MPGCLYPAMESGQTSSADRNKEPKFTIHDMRHFAISQWIAGGVPILEVSRMAGHADINITLQTYGHLFEEYSRAQEGIDFAATAIMPPMLAETAYYSAPTFQGRAKGVAQLEKPKAVIDL